MARKKTEEKLFNLDDYKDEIDKYIKDRCKKEISSETTKIYKSQIKNLKLKGYIKNLIILVLVVIIGYLSYLSYNGYEFNNGKVVKKENSSTSSVTDKASTDSQEELINRYQNLLDNIIINDSFDYKDDFYNGNLTDEAKEAIAFANLSESDLEKDDGILIISEDKIKEKEDSLFNKVGELKTFNYNNRKFAYLKSQKMFVGDEPESDTSTTHKVVNVDKNGDTIVLTSIDGIIKDNTLYNIETGEEVSKDNTDLESNKDRLNTLKYTFINGKLDKIEKAD